MGNCVKTMHRGAVGNDRLPLYGEYFDVSRKIPVTSERFPDAYFCKKESPQSRARITVCLLTLRSRAMADTDSFSCNR